MNINRETLDELMVTVSTIYNGAYNAITDKDLYYKIIAMDVPSSSAKNSYAWLGQLPRMRKWLGERVVHQLSKGQYSIANEPFELTVGINRDDIEDDTLGTYTTFFSELGDSVAKHPDEMVFDLLQKGKTELCFDGQNFFDTDHPVLDKNGDEASYSNYFAGGSAAWYLVDDSKAIKPIIHQIRKAPTFVSKTDEKDDNVFNAKEFVYGVDKRGNVGFGLPQLCFMSELDLTEANFETVYQAMLSQMGDYERPLKVAPKKLLVGSTNAAKARKILKKTETADGTNIWADIVELVVVPDLP